MRDVKYKKEGLSAITCGLIAHRLPELRVRVIDPQLLHEAEKFLRFVVDYLRTGARIRPGETMNYGYWLVKFQAVNNELLEVWEYDRDGTEFILGGSQALLYWRDQHETCAQAKAIFSPPRPDKLTCVSVGVM